MQKLSKLWVLHGRGRPSHRANPWLEIFHLLKFELVDIVGKGLLTTGRALLYPVATN